MVSTKTKIVLSVSNDLFSDQRVHKVCSSLNYAGYEVELLGRFIKGRSREVKRNYSTKRFKLWFNKGPLFYINLNLRLFFYLLGSNATIYLANDLDTLAANYLAAKLKGKKIVYDSHEYFTEVPELINRPFKQSIWRKLEGWMLPKLKFAYTVSPSLVQEYKQQYGLEMRLIRNFPRLSEQSYQKEERRNAVIYQGALNIGRGLEELINAFIYPELEGIELWLFGEGDIEDELKGMVSKLAIDDRVKFFGRLEPKELKEWTAKAKIGVSIERNLGKNYEYALPNKVFDYIHSGVPVLYSPLKDLSELIDQLNVGQQLKSRESADIAKQIRDMIESPDLASWVENCKLAAPKLSWEHEEKILFDLITDVRND